MTEESRYRILIADVPDAVARLRTALDGNYELVCTQNYDKALELIKREDFHLVIAGMLFDESRMIQLLGTVKMEMKMSHVPFLCFRHLHSSWSEAMDQSIKLTAEMLGACKFIDDAYHLSDADILHAVEECIAVGDKQPVA